MTHALFVALTNTRCAASYNLFCVASLTLRAAISLLPTDHPGRTYATGRLKIGHERLGTALSKEAASRYIESR